MLAAALEASAFTAGLERSALDDNRMLVLALTRELEIIGEAATQVSQETRAFIPDVPWDEISGMRNRLVHVYWDIDLDRVWDTVVDDLPPLIASLERALR